MASNAYLTREIVAAWRHSGDKLLAAATAVGRADIAEDAFVALGKRPETNDFDAALADFEWKTDKILGEYGGAPAIAVSLGLSGGIAIVDDLLKLAEPEYFLAAEGVAGERGSWSKVLNAYQRGGEREAVSLPSELTGKLDVLQKAGADEMVRLASSDVLLGALTSGVAGLASLGGNAVSHAVNAVSGGLSWIKEKAVRLLAWLVERLRTALPARFQEEFDEYLDSMKEKISERANESLARLLGKVLGRGACEQAWSAAREKGSDLSGPTAKLDETIADELAWIARIGEARARVDVIAGKIVPWLGGLVPNVQLLVGSAALIVVGAVAYQVDEGFDQIRELVD
ncbi:hypothetical protein VR010_11045 [Actinomycetaceae bacterium L2_0104]